MNAETPTLEPPRWRGGPPICMYENLPAFASMKELNEFRVKNALDSLLGAGASIERLWRCQSCATCTRSTSCRRRPAERAALDGNTR